MIIGHVLGRGDDIVLAFDHVGDFSNPEPWKVGSKRLFAVQYAPEEGERQRERERESAINKEIIPGVSKNFCHCIECLLQHVWRTNVNLLEDKKKARKHGQ